MATRNDKAEPAQVALLACDAQKSVLAAQSAGQHDTAVYSPYGHRDPGSPVAALGFNGELPEASTGHYLLGNGYRAYNPVLMRFNQPDSWSPFGAGGLNSYVYCVGDPINRRDPTGHMSWGGGLGLAAFGLGVLTLGASMPLAMMAATVGAAGTAADVAESGSGGLSLMHWISIGVGVASVGAVGGTLIKKKIAWLKFLNSKRTSVIQAQHQSSVIQALPEQNPLRAVPAASPVVRPAPSPVAQPAVSPAPRVSYRTIRRITAGDVNDSALRQAIYDRNSVVFSHIANRRGNRAHALRLLDELLPFRELRNRGQGRFRFGATDHNSALFKAREEGDLALSYFLEGIENVIRRY